MWKFKLKSLKLRPPAIVKQAYKKEEPQIAKPDFDILKFRLSKISPNRQLTPSEIKVIEHTLNMTRGIPSWKITDAFETIFRLNPNIKLRELANYGARLTKFSDTGFAGQRINQFVESLTKKRPAKRIHIKKSSYTKVSLKRNKLRRSIPIDAFEAWQVLRDKGVPVENLELVKKIWGFKVVESVSNGETIANIWDKLNLNNKLNVYRQCLRIIRTTWESGVIHGHMHAGNLRIVMEKGHPKVTLVDFKYAKKFDVNAISNPSEFISLITTLPMEDASNTPFGFATRLIMKVKPTTKEEDQARKRGNELLAETLRRHQAERVILNNLKIGNTKLSFPRDTPR
jgi:tRNA A-37 threonylcarbamoyl transferase component Bud32